MGDDRGIVHVCRRSHKCDFARREPHLFADDIMVGFVAEFLDQDVPRSVGGAFATLMVSEESQTANLPSVPRGRAEYNVSAKQLSDQVAPAAPKGEMGGFAQLFPIQGGGRGGHVVQRTF